MSSDIGAANDLGLVFFGSMTASISHEIKNTLAIVNENAGLLDDLALLAEKGRPLSPERLKSLSEKIRKQVQRADGIIHRLNRFAHSAGEPAATVAIRDIFDFTAALVARLTAMKNVSVLVDQGTAANIRVRPFVLENLLWLYCKHFLQVTSGEQTVELGATPSGAGMIITLTCSAGLPVGEAATRAGAEAQPLLIALGAEVDIDGSRNQVRVRLPHLAGH